MTPSDVHAWLHAQNPLLPWLVLVGLALAVNFAIDRSGFDDWLERKYSWGKVATHTATRVPVVIFFASFSAITLGRADVADYVFGAVCGLAGPLYDAIRKGGDAKDALILLLGISTAATPLSLVGCGLLESADPKFAPDEVTCFAEKRVEYAKRKEVCGARRDAECSTDALIDWKTEAEIKCTETH